MLGQEIDGMSSLHTFLCSNFAQVVTDIRDNLDLTSSTPVPVATSTPAV